MTCKRCIAVVLSIAELPVSLIADTGAIHFLRPNKKSKNIIFFVKGTIPSLRSDLDLSFKPLLILACPGIIYFIERDEKSRR
jgi:hypothetical protein